MRKVLITGGSRGIGKAIAARFDKAGYEVHCPTRAEMDLSDPDSIENYIRSCGDTVFDVIVNNAGINDINGIEIITDSEIDEMIQINLKAPIRLLRGFAGRMKENRYGRIVNIGSIWAVVSKGADAYTVPPRTGYTELRTRLRLNLQAIMFLFIDFY